MREKGFILPLALVVIVLGAVIVGFGIYFSSRPKPAGIDAAGFQPSNRENLMFVTFVDGKPDGKPGDTLRTVKVAVKNIGSVNQPPGYSLAPIGSGMLGMLYFYQNQIKYDGQIDKGFTYPKIYPWTLGKVVDDRPATSPYDDRYHWHFEENSMSFGELTAEGCQLGGGFSSVEINIDNFSGQIICRINHISAIEEIVLAGTVRKQEIVIEGTPYQLITPDGRIFYLNGKDKMLRRFVGKNVRVSGTLGASLNFKNIIVTTSDRYPLTVKYLF